MSKTFFLMLLAILVGCRSASESTESRVSKGTFDGVQLLSGTIEVTRFAPNLANFAGTVSPMGDHDSLKEGEKVFSPVEKLQYNFNAKVSTRENSHTVDSSFQARTESHGLPIQQIDNVSNSIAWYLLILLGFAFVLYISGRLVRKFIS